MESEKYICSSLNEGIDKNIDNSAIKARKALFTANYEDLSDATEEENLEILEKLSEPKSEVRKGSEMKKGVNEVVTPANTSFGDLIELVKTKYCAPRRLGNQQDQYSYNQLSNRTCSKEQEERNNKFQSAVVKLVKLTENDCNRATDSPAAQSESVGRNTRSKKRALFTKSEDYLEDASTVINLSYQDNELSKKTARNITKRRLESESTDYGDNCPTVESVVGPTEVPHEDNGHKLRLFNSSNRLLEQTQPEIEELSWEMAKCVLTQEHDEHSNMSLYINSTCLRLQLFLIDVIPEPTSEPLDLVSGYCYSGCQQLFLFSRIHWYNAGDSFIPFCPVCIKIHQERELELMFMMEWHVMDTLGLHATMLVCREYAEDFLCCSVKDFVKEEAVRKSRVQLLSDYTLQTTKNAGFSPLLDVSVIWLGRMLCLVNSSLKLPPSL